MDASLLINVIPFYFSLASRLEFMTSEDKKMYSVFVGRYQELESVALLFASAFMLCNEALSTKLQSHSWHPASRHQAPTNFILRKSMQ